ncbi:MAG TPA: TrkH family potassium uptake protein [Bacteroidales bacterium]|jgi:trk system potassium uptake protein TrkH|nr:TrkH family potassium uptake protein [Bacteroidales bacterium]OQB65496.1 MAG: Trk system potassium uptake protein TrkG [Bacteroidetes bacterium ADurb.Bin145]HOU03458.1 TrkH family potassium uptake protein [Bacteroidales bacterium]HQG63294.1 TrkH family potassium uptake protein [Bacteroidales bacterium]HQK68780.1 TrkH family potassium uptake protein [Bacteroidales bacterium]
MKFINPLVVLRIFSTILFITAILFLLCLPVAYIYNESPYPFVWSSIISVTTAAILYIISRKAGAAKLTSREGFLSVSLSWILLSALGTLPFLFSGTVDTFIDAFFESASGFTTTGSTIMKNVEILPHTILFWRSLTHWVGGLGIIVLVIIILPSLKITAQQLFSMESSLKEKIMPKTKAIGIRLLFIYLGLTFAEIILLSMGDMNLFESICHTFATVATGGFSTKNASLMAFSSYSQYIVALFMLLAGVSFVIYYYLIKFKFRKIISNEELWFYLAVIFVSGILVSAILSTGTAESREQAFRHGFFQVISITTTTGFTTTDYLDWPHSASLIIFLLLFAGASTGSTTGGIKMARHLILLKNVKAIFKKLIHPSSFTQIKLNGNPILEKTNISIISFVVLYLFIFILGTILITFAGSDPLSSASATIASLGNVGPGFGTIGPKYTFAHMNGFSKLIFSFLMIIGRLEITTLFILFGKSFWRL